MVLVALFECCNSVLVIFLWMDVMAEEEEEEEDALVLGFITVPGCVSILWWDADDDDDSWISRWGVVAVETLKEEEEEDTIAGPRLR
jgi:hypothetical protein